jgi:NADH:ubiquinone oxidoreductase subunit F (NADH-binding)
VSGARLLAGAAADGMTYQEHCDVHGPSLRLQGTELRAQLAAAGLRGRGGAAFPLSRKLDVVARRRGHPVLVANGCEGEPMSSKDRVLLRSVPHLVLDGVISLADTIGAERIIIALDEFDIRSADCVEAALSQRPDCDAARRIDIASVPGGYVSGQETALVNWCNGRDAIPTGTSRRVTTRGVRGEPTLVSNVETLAHVGLIARRGARWFRQAGTAEDPGTLLVTLSGGVVSPGVYEVEHGAALTTLLRDAGGPASPVAGVLIGGYAGGWVGPDQLRAISLDRATLRATGSRLGAGSIVVLPVDACPVSETGRVAAWMAAESAGQCGPCVHGLAGIAAALDDIRDGRDGRRALADVASWCGQIPGRGACAHPDGAVAMVASALRVFRAEFLDHADHGPCDGCDAAAILATPTSTSRAGA